MSSYTIQNLPAALKKIIACLGPGFMTQMANILTYVILHQTDSSYRFEHLIGMWLEKDIKSITLLAVQDFSSAVDNINNGIIWELAPFIWCGGGNQTIIPLSHRQVPEDGAGEL